MGVDVRNLSLDAVDSLPLKLREVGLEVELIGSVRPQSTDPPIMRIRCRRGGDELVIGLAPDPKKSGECRIVIPNQSGWRSSTRRRRYQLQSDITAVIDRNGGYWPFQDPK